MDLWEELKKIDGFLAEAMVWAEGVSTEGGGSFTQMEHLNDALEHAAILSRNALERLRSCVDFPQNGKPVLPEQPIYGTIRLFNGYWLHIRLETLLPHCRFQAPAYLGDALTRLLDGIYFQKELTLFHSYTDKIPTGRTGLIFMGESLSEIGEAAFQTEQNEEQATKKKYHADSFAKVFSVTSLPVHFVPIGKSGAQMLRYLAMENYRERLARTILRGSYRPPYEGLTDTDAIHFQAPHLPAVVALDLDIKRMDRALVAAQERGFPKLVLYALPEQTAFLRGRYGNQADIIAVDAARLDQEIMTDKPQDSSMPYMTKDGRWVDIANFAVYRKTQE